MRHSAHSIICSAAHASCGGCLAGIDGAGHSGPVVSAFPGNSLVPGVECGGLGGMGRPGAMANRVPRSEAHGRSTVKRIRHSGTVRISHLVPKRPAALCPDRPSDRRSVVVRPTQRATFPRRPATRAPARTSHLIDSARLVKPITRLRSLSGERLNFNKGSGSIQVAARRPSSQESKAL
jgi:hypothetical protein